MSIRHVENEGLELIPPLFRAISLNSGDWVYGCGWFEYSPNIVLHGDYGPLVCLKESVGQFVGITDKNALRAFSGDLFYWHGSLREIVYRNDKGAFMARKVGSLQKSYFYLADIENKFEIVGNTLQHKDLPLEVN